LSHILLTHGHDDHQGGISELFSELKKRNMLPLPNVYKYQSPSGSFPVKRFSSVQNICNGDTFSTDGATVQAMYAPGHTDDHVCFVLKENEALLSGDCILGCGSAVFEDLHSYMNSLKRLRNIMKDGYPWVLESDANCSMLSITSIFPGHGPVLSSSVIEKVDEYIAHREERERQIVDYLRSHCTPTMSWRSSWEVMSNIYPSTLPLIVKMSAQYNVQHHLSKLVVDGVVTSAWPDLWKVTNADYK
jgi:glyoxylase-like metal-dependent hydrolase (beta-lactamase superfamily II)